MQRAGEEAPRSVPSEQASADIQPAEVQEPVTAGNDETVSLFIYFFLNFHTFNYFFDLMRCLVIKNYRALIDFGKLFSSKQNIRYRTPEFRDVKLINKK